MNYKANSEFRRIVDTDLSKALLIGAKRRGKGNIGISIINREWADYYLAFAKGDKNRATVALPPVIVVGNLPLAAFHMGIMMSDLMGITEQFLRNEYNENCPGCRQSIDYLRKITVERPLFDLPQEVQDGIEQAKRQFKEEIKQAEVTLV